MQYTCFSYFSYFIIQLRHKIILISKCIARSFSVLVPNYIFLLLTVSVPVCFSHPGLCGNFITVFPASWASPPAVFRSMQPWMTHRAPSLTAYWEMMAKAQTVWVWCPDVSRFSLGRHVCQHTAPFHFLSTNKELTPRLSWRLIQKSEILVSRLRLFTHIIRSCNPWPVGSRSALSFLKI